MPQRIQLRRTKGWKKPPGAVVVARNTRWGNPFRAGGQYLCVDGVVVPDGWPARSRAGDAATVGQRVKAGGLRVLADGCEPAAGQDCRRVALDAAGAVAAFRAWAGRVLARDPGWLDDLRGKDLCCWCVGEPCHASVLLELADR